MNCLIGLNLATVPEIPLAGIQQIPAAGNEYLMCRLLLAAHTRFQDPDEPWLNDVNAHGVNPVLTAQIPDTEVRIRSNSANRPGTQQAEQIHCGKSFHIKYRF
jgi:hypothetical protein